MAKIQDIDIPHLEFAEGAAPGTPASAIVRLYAKADGLLYSKDDAGTETVVSGGGAGSSAASGARVYNSGNIALNNGSATYLTFNTERYDDAAYHDTGSNTGRLTVPSAGRYMVGGHVQMTNGVGDPAYIFIRVSGTTVIAVSAPGATTNEAAYISITTVWDCTGGTEYFELGCWASAGSKNAVAASAFSPEFWIERMGDT